MRERKVIKTTVGELIVAVTDEVVPLVRDSSDLYRVASCIINDVLARQSLARSQVVTRKVRKEFG